ncbi:MAG: hypothetical protein Alis3KO_32380 [Aliiglaciecola sp.]
MPYSKAHFYVLAIIPITVLAFWQSYFGRLSEAPVEHHIHGVSSTLWILLIAAQSWSIHNKHVTLHKNLGKSLFILTPIMVGAFALVTYAGAEQTVLEHPFYLMFGEALLTTDVMLTFAIPLQIYLALRFRRQVLLHSALMLSTLTGLLPPILARLFAAIMPGMTIRGPDTLYRFEYCLLLAITVSMLLALYMYWRYRKQGWPWLFAAGLCLMMFVLYYTLGQSDAWSAWVNWLASQPMIGVFVLGAILGIVACLTGWKQGKQR